MNLIVIAFVIVTSRGKGDVCYPLECGNAFESAQAPIESCIKPV
jgi:hypothetical protein